MSITLHAHYTLGYTQPPLQWRLTTSPHYAPPLQRQWVVCLHCSQNSGLLFPCGVPTGSLLPQGYLPVYTSRGKERERIGGVIFIEFNYPVYMDNPTLVRNWFTLQTKLTPHMQTDFTPSEGEKEISFHKPSLGVVYDWFLIGYSFPHSRVNAKCPLTILWKLNFA